MPPAATPPTSYEFVFAGGDYNTYFFETGTGVIYEIRFKEFFYFFGPAFPFSQYTDEFVMDVAERPTPSRLSVDSRIPATVAAIFQDFYRQIPDTAVIYVCDSRDSKQVARQRKFTAWFGNFSQDDFFKVDAILLDRSGIIIPTSLILKSNNPFFLQIIDQFRKITSGYTEDK